MSISIIIGLIITAIMAPVLIRASFQSGLRGFFSAGTGAIFLLTWLLGYSGWRSDHLSMFAMHGFAVVGWVLVIGGRLQMMFRHGKAYERFRRDTPVFRSFGRSPRLLPAFSLDLRWLGGGAAVTAVAGILVFVAPEGFLLIWAQTAIGAFLIVGSTGAFASGRAKGTARGSGLD